MATVRLAREYLRIGGAEVERRGGTVPASTKARTDMVVGVDYAGPGNCGVEQGITLTPDNTNFTFGASQSGSLGNPFIVQNTQFNRRPAISNAQYLKFRNCKFRGEPSTAIECITSTNAGNVGIEFESCTWDPQNPMFRTNANRGSHNTSYKWCEFKHLIDGAGHTNSGGYVADQKVSFTFCWAHDYWYASPDQDAAGGADDNASHVDMLMQWRGGPGLYVGGCRVDGLLGAGLETLGTQITSFTDITPSRTGSDAYRMSVDTWSGGVIVAHLRGNKYFDYIRDSSGGVVQPPTLLYPSSRQYGQATSLFMFSPNLGPLGGMTFESNLFDGGSASFNFNPAYTTVATTAVSHPQITAGEIKIINNKWGPMDDPTLQPSMRNGPTWSVIANSALPLTITGNTRTDTGAAFNQRKAG
jgi:hypothetical protein